MSTSGMHRRPFEGRHLVLIVICNFGCYFAILFAICNFVCYLQFCLLFAILFAICNFVFYLQFLFAILFAICNFVYYLQFCLLFAILVAIWNLICYLISFDICNLVAICNFVCNLFAICIFGCRSIGRELFNGQTLCFDKTAPLSPVIRRKWINLWLWFGSSLHARMVTSETQSDKQKYLN